MIRSLFLFLGLMFCSSLISAQSNNSTPIEDLSWMDENYMQQQLAKVDTIVQTRLGSRLRGDLSDLETLQQIVDRGLIERNDTLRLQALGVVLGNVMAAEVPKLQWKIYEDGKGRSRALCVENTEECLFPVTMLSRRMEVGLNPDVKSVYKEALELIDPYLPEMPYGASRR